MHIQFHIALVHLSAGFVKIGYLNIYVAQHTARGVGRINALLVRAQRLVISAQTNHSGRWNEGVDRVGLNSLFLHRNSFKPFAGGFVGRGTQGGGNEQYSENKPHRCLGSEGASGKGNIFMHPAGDSPVLLFCLTA